MDATELGHRVIAVLHEDSLVELLCPAHPNGGIDRRVTLDVELTNKLVEEQAAETLVGP